MSYKAGVRIGDSVYYADKGDLRDAEKVFVESGKEPREGVGFIIPRHKRVYELRIDDIDPQSKLLSNCTDIKPHQLELIAEEAERRAGRGL